MLPITNPVTEIHFFGISERGKTAAGCENVKGNWYFLKFYKFGWQAGDAK